MPLEFVLTYHAEHDRVQVYDIAKEWIAYTLENPDYRDNDPDDPWLHRHWAWIGDANGKVLRVVFDSRTSPYRVITVHWDRNMKKRFVRERQSTHGISI